MKTMTLTVHKRPEYLAKVLDSLKANSNLQDYKLFLGIEPGDDTVVDICKSIDFMDVDFHLNVVKLGVRNNPYMTLTRAFNAGSDFNVYLESDVVVSPDMTKLTDWYLKQDHTDIMSLNLWYSNNEQFFKESQFEGESDIVKSKNFNALGLAITKTQWEQYLKNTWMLHKSGWDHSFIEKLKNEKLYTLTPKLSRSHHIGRDGGVHYRAQLHDHLYVNNIWNQTDKVFEYKII